MVDYAKAIKIPFLDAGKLFAGTFILLGFGAAGTIVSFMLSILSVAGYTIASTIFSLVTSALVYAIPTAFFVRLGINFSKKKFITPSWKDLGAMFVEGIQVIIISTIYYLPISILTYVILGINPLTIQSQTPEMQQALAENIITRLPLALLIILPLYLLLMYLMPVILLRFMETKKFSKGFDFSTIFRKAFTVKYLAAWLIALLLIIGLTIAVVILALILVITIIGIIPLVVLVLPMYMYLLGVITYGIYGQAYGEVK